MAVIDHVTHDVSTDVHMPTTSNASLDYSGQQGLLIRKVLFDGIVGTLTVLVTTGQV